MEKPHCWRRWSIVSSLDEKVQQLWPEPDQNLTSVWPVSDQRVHAVGVRMWGQVVGVRHAVKSYACRKTDLGGWSSQLLWLWQGNIYKSHKFKYHRRCRSLDQKVWELWPRSDQRIQNWGTMRSRSRATRKQLFYEIIHQCVMNFEIIFVM